MKLPNPPVAGSVSRPDASKAIAAYRILTAVDSPLNAFPSLYAAFALFSALCAAQVFRELQIHRLWRFALGGWTVLILLGTLFDETTHRRGHLGWKCNRLRWLLFSFQWTDSRFQSEAVAIGCQRTRIAIQFNCSMKLLPAAIVCLILGDLGSAVRADEESDRAGLRMIRTNYMEAANSGDPSKIASFLSKDVTGVMVTGEEVKGLDGLQAYWKKIQNLIGPGGSYHVTVNVDKTDLYDNTAVSHGNTDDLVRLGTGQELRFNSLWTAVCHKENGVWKVVRMEAAMDPVDNIFISLKTQKTRLFAGACGLALGIALDVAVVLLKRRTSANPTKASVT